MNSGFIKSYLTQPSTWTGLLKIIGGLGIHVFSPSSEELLVNILVHGFAVLFDAAGLYDTMRNEKKEPVP